MPTRGVRRTPVVLSGRAGRRRLRIARHARAAFERRRAEYAQLLEQHPRPLTRGDCQGGPRPCPWVSCRHHLYLDVSETGALRINAPGIEDLGEMVDTCSLDVADRGRESVDGVAERLLVTGQAVKRITRDALIRLRLPASRLGGG